MKITEHELDFTKRSEFSVPGQVVEVWSGGANTVWVAVVRRDPFLVLKVRLARCGSSGLTIGEDWGSLRLFRCSNGIYVIQRQDRP